MNQFFKQVYSIVEQIPYGRVVSYGQIARNLGRPHAPREVGWAMRSCPNGLPWQRVVLKDGTLAKGVNAVLQRAILETEGVVFLSNGRIDMDLCCWLESIKQD